VPSPTGVRVSRTLFFLVNDAGFFLSHRLELALEATRRGFRAAVICPRDDNAGRLADHGIEHLELAMPRGRGGLIAELKAMLALYRLLRADRPTVLHLITSKPIIVGGLVARLLGIPVVAAVSGLGHVFIERSLKAAVMRRLVLMGYRAALKRDGAFVIFQNEDNRDLFEQAGINGGRDVLIRGSGTALERFDPAPRVNANAIVVLPARMLWTKGVGEFVEAARVLRGKGYQAEFQLVGDPDPGNPASIPRSTLEAWSNEGIVRWQPHRTDIEAVLRDCDIVVLPSYLEGLPKTLIDAAASGRAVVTTDVPGCRHAIVPRETGLLVRPRDAGDLAEKIAVLLDDRALCSRMGSAGRRLAEREFGLDRVTEQHFALYERAVAAREVTSG
jgi:glycosyltransferase involved in cell wall biosynthesis